MRNCVHFVTLNGHIYYLKNILNIFLTTFYYQTNEKKIYEKKSFSYNNYIKFCVPEQSLENLEPDLIIICLEIFSFLLGPTLSQWRRVHRYILFILYVDLR